MGKYFPYENSNWRTFIVDTTAETIKRPNRAITKADMTGALIEIDGYDCIVVAANETDTVVNAVLSINGMTLLTYTKATDTFTVTANGGVDPAVTLTNVFIDEYGRKEMYI